MKAEVGEDSENCGCLGRAEGPEKQVTGGIGDGTSVLISLLVLSFWIS